MESTSSSRPGVKRPPIWRISQAATMTAMERGFQERAGGTAGATCVTRRSSPVAAVPGWTATNWAIAGFTGIVRLWRVLGPVVDEKTVRVIALGAAEPSLVRWADSDDRAGDR